MAFVAKENEQMYCHNKSCKYDFAGDEGIKGYLISNKQGAGCIGDKRAESTNYNINFRINDEPRNVEQNYVEEDERKNRFNNRLNINCVMSNNRNLDSNPKSHAFSVLNETSNNGQHLEDKEENRRRNISLNAENLTDSKATYDNKAENEKNVRESASFSSDFAFPRTEKSSLDAHPYAASGVRLRSMDGRNNSGDFTQANEVNTRSALDSHNNSTHEFSFQQHNNVHNADKDLALSPRRRKVFDLSSDSSAFLVSPKCNKSAFLNNHNSHPVVGKKHIREPTDTQNSVRSLMSDVNISHGSNHYNMKCDNSDLTDKSSRCLTAREMRTLQEESHIFDYDNREDAFVNFKNKHDNMHFNNNMSVEKEKESLRDYDNKRLHCRQMNAMYSDLFGRETPTCYPNIQAQCINEKNKFEKDQKSETSKKSESLIESRLVTQHSDHSDGLLESKENSLTEKSTRLVDDCYSKLRLIKPREIVELFLTNLPENMTDSCLRGFAYSCECQIVRYKLEIDLVNHKCKGNAMMCIRHKDGGLGIKKLAEALAADNIEVKYVQHWPLHLYSEKSFRNE